MKYTDDMPRLLVEAGKEGKGISEFASENDISRAIVYLWAKEKPEMAEAFELHRTHLQAWWEKAGRLGLTSKEFNATVWCKNMHNRFRDEWGEKVDVDLGGAVTVNSIVRKIVDPAGGGA